MPRTVNAEYVGDAAEAIDRISVITHRSSQEVLADMANTYLWIISQQTIGRRIIAMNSSPEDEQELAKLIEDDEAARAYFREMGWL